MTGRHLGDLVASSLPPRDVTEQAACRGVDPDLFFPVRGAPCTEAKRICAGCPVQEPCKEWAIETRQPYGIFGGLSARQRSQARRRLGATRAPSKSWLPDKAVEAIRLDFKQLWDAGHPNVYRVVTTRHGISRQALGGIVTGRVYRNAPGPIHTPLPGRGRHAKPAPNLPDREAS